MTRGDGGMPQMSGVFPRPGPVLKAVMGTLFALWLFFAIATNWFGGVPLWRLFVGNVDGVLSGEVWRLFTAPLMHAYTGGRAISHILWTVLGIYFLGHSLESQWGGRRFLRFLLFSGWFAYTFQFLLALAAPSIFGRLAGSTWYGAFPVVEAVAVAWALSNRDRSVHLMMVIPIKGKMLLWIVIGFSVLNVIVDSQAPAGNLAPFGGMLSGWLLGGSTPSPLRRWYLRRQLGRLEGEARRDAADRKKRVQRSGLRVIDGGKKDGSDEDDDDPSPPRYLN